MAALIALIELGSIAAHVDTGGDAAEAWRERLTFYRELGASVKRLASDDLTEIQEFVAPISAVSLSANG